MFDEEEFGKRYLKHHPGVRSYFLGKGFSPEDAEDLTQITFSRVYVNRDQYGRGSFEGWLRRIMENVYKNKIRDMKTQKVTGDEIPIENMPEQDIANDQTKQNNSLETMIEKEQRALLKQAVSQLPPTLRPCLVLRVYHDLTYKQIAVILDLHYETVKSRLHQARDKLRETLGKKVYIDL